jgi:hypothetical protein
MSNQEKSQNTDDFSPNIDLGSISSRVSTAASNPNSDLLDAYDEYLNQNDLFTQVEVIRNYTSDEDGVPIFNNAAFVEANEIFNSALEMLKSIFVACEKPPIIFNVEGTVVTPLLLNIRAFKRSEVIC